MATDIRGTVFKNGSSVMMARIVGLDDQPLATSDVLSVHYSVAEIDHADHDTLLPVDGHNQVDLTVAQVFYDALQTGAPWNTDPTGYNFRHDIDVSVNEAFPTAGVEYQVRYEVVPVVGQKFVFRFRVRCI